MNERSTASIIIIGDEILNGKTKDTNSHFLCKELYKCGIRVSRISVISDDVDVIAEEVISHAKQYSYVITTGGIGPTHDDVTYEGVAKAFGEKLVLNENLFSILSQYCNEQDLDEYSAVKLSHIPQNAEVHQTGNKYIPIVSVHNVFIFPGIPSYLETTFVDIKSIFNKLNKPFYNCSLYINLDEFNIASILNEAVSEFDQRVKFGSYPDVHNRHYQVQLILESDSKEWLIEAEAFLRSHLLQNTVVGQYPPNSKQALEVMSNICFKNTKSDDSTFSKTLEKSLDVLESCFKQYSIQKTCISFNGGKDCTVLLHLTYLFLFKKDLIQNNKLKVFHVCSQQPFPEIENFIEHCRNRYNLDVLSYKPPIKAALSNLKEDHPEIEAVLMGSRHTDPHCSLLQPFQKTDSDWPKFMRVNPLSHWTYSDVWKFLRELEVPYCSLYDKGYTSLGCQHNTLPNEQLIAKRKDGRSYYQPAYLLKDPEQERKGRAARKSS